MNTNLTELTALSPAAPSSGCVESYELKELHVFPCPGHIGTYTSSRQKEAVIALNLFILMGQSSTLLPAVVLTCSRQLSLSNDEIAAGVTSVPDVGVLPSLPIDNLIVDP